MKHKYKIILAIRVLNIGGAERQFLEIVKNIDRNLFDVHIISMYSGHLDHEIKNNNFICFNKKRRTDLCFFIRLFNYINHSKPDIIYSFMPAMNITMAIAKLFTNTKAKLIWGQFGSKPDYKNYTGMRKQIYLIQKKFEPLANAITADGRKGIEFYQELNMKLKKTAVIFSGTDIQRFIRNEDKRREFRRKYDLNMAAIAVGICSRLDVMKGYLVLAEVAKLIMENHSNVLFFSIGYGDGSIVIDAERILGDYSDRFVWMGKQLSPEDIMSGWDIYCSPSLFGEGFSNSIIEAMSCSLPVIATEVGEAKHQVAPAGKVVVPGDVTELYNALDAWIMDGSYKERGIESRKRVEDNFSSILMTKKTEDFIKQIASN